MTIKTPKGDKNIGIEELNDYIVNEDYLLFALVHTDSKGVIDLVKKRGSEKSIFVDRKKELDDLKKKLDEVIEDGCSVVVVRGEVGIGKTSICMQFKKYSRKKG